MIYSVHRYLSLKFEIRYNKQGQESSLKSKSRSNGWINADVCYTELGFLWFTEDVY